MVSRGLPTAKPLTAAICLADCMHRFVKVLLLYPASNAEDLRNLADHLILLKYVRKHRLDYQRGLQQYSLEYELEEVTKSHRRTEKKFF